METGTITYKNEEDTLHFFTGEDHQPGKQLSGGVRLQSTVIYGQLSHHVTYECNITYTTASH